MKKLLCYALAVALSLVVIPLMSTGENTGEKLSAIAPPPENSIPISNWAELDAVRDGKRGASYHLTADIDLSRLSSWEPIADFSGIFDGQGYAIKGITLTATLSNYVVYSGLFANISGSEIKNLGVEGSAIILHETFLGGICGVAEKSVITNCYSAVDVSGSGYGTFYVGGICGNARETVIIGSYNLGNISVSLTDWGSIVVGGIIGGNTNSSNQPVTIDKCYNQGNVSATGNAHVGGISGGTRGSFGSPDMYSEDEITNSYNTGNISAMGVGGENYASGICSVGTMRGCYNGGSIAVQQGTYGGIAGITTNGNVRNSYWCIDNAFTKNDFDLLNSEKLAVGQYGTGSAMALTTSEMKEQSSFLGWDFNTIWEINPNKNNGYPTIRLSAATSPTVKMNPNSVLGDLNGDGVVDAYDMAILKKALLGIE